MRLSTLVFSCLVALASGSGADAQTRPSAVMLRTPDVSGEHIAFQYAGDLWLAPKAGGVATRLTSAPGDEGFPKFSPDGSKVAFMGSYDGGSDLYVVPTAGGVPLRVTHHPDTETLNGWHPDGERLLYWSSEVSGQRRAPKIFLVSASGGQPEPVPLPYGTFGSIDDTGTWLAYTPLTREFRTWKRYQGGMAQDVWLLNLATKKSRQVTNEPGTDAMPMWHGKKVVFMSDRDASGVMNLYAYNMEGGVTERLTDFEEFDVKFASAGPDDVVFENEGKLYRYEFDGGQTVPVEIVIPGDRPTLRAQSHDLKDLLQDADLGPGAKRVVVEARGEILTVPVDEGIVRNLTGTSGVAERDPAWSPDGKWIVYFSDRSGEYELTLRRSDGKPFDGADENGEKKLTSIGEGWKFGPSWSPDSKYITFTSNAGDLMLYDVAGAALKKIDTNPVGFPLRADWSGDSSWLAWSRPQSASELESIHLYDVAAGAHHEVTSGMFDDEGPAFDLKGEWLFYRSSRTFQPTYSDFDTTWIYTNSQNLVAVPLRADVKNPWAPKNDEEEFEEEGKEEEEPKKEGADEGEDAGAASAQAPAEGEAAGAGERENEGQETEEKEKEKEKEEPKKPLEIELEGFEGRAIQLPVPAGRFGSLEGLAGKLAYVRMPRNGSESETPKLVLYDLEKKEEQTVLEGVEQFGASPKGDKLLVQKGSDIGVVDPAPDQKFEAIDLSELRATIDPREEWRQLLVDCWRLFRDYFYDAGMHGLDWPAIRARYEGALADATSRADVHYLMGEMMAELNVGHAYNSGPRGVRGGPQPRAVGLLGCDWKLENGAYRVARILGGGDYDTDARSPLAENGVDAKQGDFLLAVNGIPVDVTKDVYAAFEGTAEEPTLLTLNENPTFDGSEREVLVRPLRGDAGLRYRDWVASKRQMVDAKGGGRIGYVHVPDTGINGQNELVRQLMGQMHREALIVDERWNGGGQIPTRFIELLDRPIRNYWATRHGEEWTWPPVGHRGPKAMLINHSAGSGGDCFPYYFRQAGLGKLIGTRTWGGLVGLSGNPALIDGGAPRVPTFGFFELDGTWGIEGHGVEPDIEVIDDPAQMQNGEDPQLETAVGHLLQELETWTGPEKRRPAGPDRRKPGIEEQDK